MSPRRRRGIDMKRHTLTPNEFDRRGRLQAAHDDGPAKAGPYVGLVIVLALMVSACSLRPPYKAPTLEPTILKNADATLVVEQRFDPRWWGQFEDPVLDTLMSRALTANHDVRIAVARFDQARAIFDDVHLDRYPTATVGAVADRRSEAIPGFSDEPRTISTYRAGFDAFWELDVF